jgi:hypothetical protein
MNIERMKKLAFESAGLSKQYGAGARMVAKYGFHYLQGNRRPYFSVTADISTNASRRRHDIEAGGCLHDDIAENLPEIAHLIKWHLVDDDAQPVHYIANGAYWLEYVHGINKYPRRSYEKTDPLDHFKSTVVFGAVETDEAELAGLLAPLAEGAHSELLEERIVLTLKRDELKKRVETFCLKRLDRLREVMFKEMAEAGIEFIKPEEYQRAD